MTKVYVSTVPFATVSDEPARLLREAGLDYEVNPYDRKMRAEEMKEVLPDIDYLVAGIEPLDADVLAHAPKLKLIARVGIGLDTVDLGECKRRGIVVTYTPDAPTLAVAELNIGFMLDALRRISYTSEQLHRRNWVPHMGMLLRGRTVGILGLGRIGKSTAQILSGFRVRLLACDPVWDIATARALDVERCSQEQLLKQSDVLVICVPLEPDTVNLIGAPELALMRPSSVLVNAARGGIVDEVALAEALGSGQIAYACTDVYSEEPYTGPLCDLPNITLSGHMGAGADVCRIQMEVGAVEEVVRHDRGLPPLMPVP